tara:strand:- start:278 stop:532 length:255 start_codon:yes stop_codon:yes gene_type:complete
VVDLEVSLNKTHLEWLVEVAVELVDILLKKIYLHQQEQVYQLLLEVEVEELADLQALEIIVQQLFQVQRTLLQVVAVEVIVIVT